MDKKQTHPSTDDQILEIDSSKVPTLEKSSLDLLTSLYNLDKRLVEFEDNLVIYSLSGVEIGTFQISVKPAVFKNKSCFNVKAKSQGLLDDAPCGTQIDSFVSEKFETLEQEYCEYIMLPKNRLERKTKISLENDAYVIKRWEKSQNDEINFTYRIKKTLLSGFVSESSNIIIQRLLIQNKIVDSFTLFTFDSEINPCTVTYNSLEERLVKIADEEYCVQGIERTIESIADLPTTWQIYFTQDGHMCNRIQVGYPAVMKLKFKPKPIEIDEYLPKLILKNKDFNWENDMQLKSMHMDRKDELKNEYDEYLHDHPEAKALIADYMQAVLTFKPSDVVTFTSKFFASYSKTTKESKFLPSLNQAIEIPKHS